MRKSLTRRYLVEVTDVKANTTILLTPADWTVDEKQVALAQIFRLARRRASNSPRMPSNPKKLGKG